MLGKANTTNWEDEGALTYGAVAEAEFGKSCTKILKMSLTELNGIPGVGEEHRFLLQKQFPSLEKLMQQGIRFKPIGTIPPKQWASSLNSAAALLQILTQQPVTTQNNSESSDASPLGTSDSPEFSFQHVLNKIVITHKNDASYFKIIFGKLKKERVPEFELKTQLINPFYMINHWYIISSELANGKKNSLLYCSESHELMAEEYYLNFPMDKLKKDYYSKIVLAPFYREQQFNVFLEEYGWSIGKLREIPDMTQKKLEILYKYSPALWKLLAKEVSVLDIAKVDETRLVSLFSNFNAIEAAFDLIDVQSFIKCNGQQLSNYSPKLFPAIDVQTQSIKKEEVKSQSNCYIS